MGWKCLVLVLWHSFRFRIQTIWKWTFIFFNCFIYVGILNLLRKIFSQTDRQAWEWYFLIFMLWGDTIKANKNFPQLQLRSSPVLTRPMGLFGASRLRWAPASPSGWVSTGEDQSCCCGKFELANIVEPQKQKDKDKSVFGLFELLN